MRMQLRPWRSAAPALFALVFALLLSASFSGSQRSFMIDQGSLRKRAETSGAEQNNKELALLHARMLKAVTTNDYGTYDPTPSMEKPHFKPIPN